MFTLSQNPTVSSFRPAIVLLVALAAGREAIAHPPPVSGTAGSKVGTMHASYSVINLSASVRTAASPDINARGQVAFALGSGGGLFTSYIYDGTAVHDIGSLGGSEVVALDLNDRGQITGRATTPAGVQHAFVWNGATGIIDITEPAPVDASVATAINNEGVVTG